MIAADLSRIAMSSTLVNTLSRAVELARGQGHHEVTLEHMLVSLCEDPDAGLVLAASNIDVSQVRRDVGQFLSGLDRLAPPGQGPDPVVSSDLRRIIEAAAAAARGGRRREINGAIVLAAIVGDGKSPAAQILHAQGLTFDGAIRALQRSAGAAPKPSAPSASTEDLLASARKRVQSRTVPSLANAGSAEEHGEEGYDEEPEFAPAPAPPAPPAEPPPPEPRPPAVEARAPEADYAPIHEHEPHLAAPQNAAAPHEGFESPSFADDRTPMAPPPLPGDEGFDQRYADALEQSFEPAPEAPFRPPADAGGFDGWRGPDDGIGGMPGGSGPPPLPGDEALEESWTPPPSPPLPHAPPAPAMPRAPVPPPMVSRPATAPPGAFPRPRVRTEPPAPMRGPEGLPAAPSALDELMQAHGVGAAESAPYPPALDRILAETSNVPREAHSPRPAPRPVPRTEVGQLVENIPRMMRVAVPALIEVRIARGDVQALAEGLQGGGAAYRHDVTITKAMTVRLRAPDGGFYIETASPETQWIERTGLIAADEYASWRWHVTPRERGRRRLQLIISARTVSGDGLTAETALPDQVVTVRVRTNYGQSMSRTVGWVVAALIGGLLARFGEGAFDAAAQLLGRLSQG